MFHEWFSGEDAQKAATEDNQANAGSLNNNFYIRNAEIENEKYELTSDTLIFVLDGAQLKPADYQQFVQEDITDRLFRLSLVGDKVVLLEEAYRP
ncbi:hypothetical protein [Paenibacillus sp. HB172176]|uniref:hypothetical protein n=1 Tax=Paenibacillus sp. HB172176 TaxID=2493690 RepID=UPI0014396A4F|nr:hypothetical protein [Paenibacillus sp. HB172176]